MNSMGKAFLGHFVCVLASPGCRTECRVAEVVLVGSGMRARPLVEPTSMVLSGDSVLIDVSEYDSSVTLEGHVAGDGVVAIHGPQAPKLGQAIRVTAEEERAALQFWSPICAAEGPDLRCIRWSSQSSGLLARFTCTRRSRLWGD